MLGPGTARLVWGKPRRAEDVDLASGTRRAATCCPRPTRPVAPNCRRDGDALLFTATPPLGQPRSGCRTEPTARTPKSITPGSDPMWLRNGEEFLYGIDPIHAAVFSLPTMSFSLLAGSRPRRHQMIAEKAVSPRADALALLVGGRQRAVGSARLRRSRASITDGPSAFRRCTTSQFDRRSTVCCCRSTSRPSLSTLTSLDWRHGRFETSWPLSWARDRRRRGRRRERTDLLGRRRDRRTPGSTIGPDRRRLTNDGQSLLGAPISPTGDLLLGKLADDGAHQHLAAPAPMGLRARDNGPDDAIRTSAPTDRRWAYVDYAQKSIDALRGRATAAACPSARTRCCPHCRRFRPTGRRSPTSPRWAHRELIVSRLEDGDGTQTGADPLAVSARLVVADIVWSFEGSGGHYPGSNATSRAAAGDRRTRCRTRRPGRSTSGELLAPERRPRSPFFRRVRVETEETRTLLRLDRLGR